MELKEEHFYHVYNRGINSAVLFRTAEDYQQFLDSYTFYCFLALDTYAYCLLNNHFHFLVRVRTVEEQEDLFFLYRRQDQQRFYGLNYRHFKPQNSSRQLGHLFNSYTRSFNLRNDATGPLLEGRFKRIEVDNQLYRARLVCYIHRNPIHHRLAQHYGAYRWSSYKTFAPDSDPGFINRQEVYSWFGGRDGFQAAHEEMRLTLGQELRLE